MTKIKFNRAVLYNIKDYENQIDIIDSTFKDSLKYLLSNIPTNGGVLSGFTFELNTSTGINVIHTSNNQYSESFGILVNKSGLFIYTSTAISSIDLSAYLSDTAYLMIQPISLEGSIDNNGDFTSTGKVSYVDYNIYSTYQEQSFQLNIYSSSEYAALPTDEKTQQILIGCVVLNGTGILSFDYSLVNYTGVILKDNTIPDENVALDAMIKPSKAATVSSENDHYTGEPINLEEFLWKVITQIRKISSSTYWDDPVTFNITNSNAEMNKFRRSGKIKEWNNLAVAFPTSWQISIDTGLALDYGIIVPNQEKITFDINERSILTIGTFATKTNPEKRWFGSTPYSITTHYNNLVSLSTFHITAPSAGSEYTYGPDYNVSLSTGTVNTPLGSNIVNEYSELYYQTYLSRWDLIYFDNQTQQLLKREGTSSKQPERPTIHTSSGEVGFCYIFISEYNSTGLSSLIIFPCSGYIDDLPYIQDIPHTDSSLKKEINKITYYTSTGLYTTGLSYTSTSTGRITSQYFVQSSSGWVISSSGASTTFYKKYTSGIYQDVFLEFFIFTKENHCVWIECDHTISSDSVKVVIDDNWASPYIVSLTTLSSILITDALTEGYHTIKVMKATNNTQQIKIKKLIYGLESTFYSTSSINQASSSAIQSITTNFTNLQTTQNAAFLSLQTNVNNQITNFDTYLTNHYNDNYLAEYVTSEIRQKLFELQQYTSDDIESYLYSSTNDNIIFDLIQDDSFILKSFPDSEIRKTSGHILNGVWSTGGDLTEGRSTPGGCGYQTSGLAIAGNNTGAIDSVELYNGLTWSDLADVNTAVLGCSACGFQYSALKVGGGVSYEIDTTEKYNGSVWSTSTNINTARYLHAGCGIQDAALIFGGMAWGGSNYTSTEEFNGTTWVYGGDLFEPVRSLGGSGLQNSGLAFGGTTSTGVVSTTEEYNGSAWATGGSILLARKGLSGCGIQTSSLNFGGTVNGTKSESYDGIAWNSSTDMVISVNDHAGCGTQIQALSFGGDGFLLTSFEYNTGVFNFSFSNETKKFKGVCLIPFLSSHKKNLLHYDFSINDIDSPEISNKQIETIQENSSTLSSNKFLFRIYPKEISIATLTSTGIITTDIDDVRKFLTSNLILVKDTLTNNDGFYKISSVSGSEIIIDTTYSQTKSNILLRGFVQSVELFYDRMDDVVWITGGDLPSAKYGLGGCGLQTASLAFGGYSGTYLDATEEYNGTAWTESGVLNYPRRFLSGCGYQNAALSFGGSTSSVTYTRYTEEYNGSIWIVVTQMLVGSSKKYLAGAGVQNAALEFGGSDGSRSATSSKYNGTVWSATSSLNTAVEMLGGSGLQNAALSFGGDSGSYTTRVEEFNGTVWATASSLNLAREDLSGCGIQASSVCYGGNTGSASSVTEEYNGVSWINKGALNIARFSSAGSGRFNSPLAFGGNSTNSTEEGIVSRLFNFFEGYGLKLF